MGQPSVDDRGFSPATPPKELCLVTPSCRRAWDNGTFKPISAGSAFTGPFSRKCQSYAEKFYPGAWCILDARSGFLFPDEVIRKQHSACLFRPWTEPMGLEDLRAQVRKRKLDQYERIIVMGGRRFIILVEDAFPGKRVKAPLAGVGGIGEMMREMNLALGSGHRL
jgi:hypothetical protein